MTTFQGKGRDSRREAPVTHKDVCTAVAKISAYLRVGDKEKARTWATKLVGYLRTLDLLIDRQEDDIHR